MKRRYSYRKAGRTGGGKGRLPPPVPGTITAIVMLVLLISAAAAAAEKQMIPLEQVGLFGKVCFGIAALLGCLLAARRATSLRLVWTAATGAVVLLLTLGAAAARAGTLTLRPGVPLAITAAAALLAALPRGRNRSAGYR